MNRKTTTTIAATLAAAAFAVTGCDTAQSLVDTANDAKEQWDGATREMKDWTDGDSGAAPAVESGNVDVAHVRTQLGKITVAPESETFPYDDDVYDHWRSTGGGCDIRADVLKAQAAGQVSTTGSCKVVSGEWFSLYDGKTYTDAGDLDIDHIVPLKEAHMSGASKWNDTERADYANDETLLLAVSASENRSKGPREPGLAQGDDPEVWNPSDGAFVCQHAALWVDVKYRYRLTVDQQERANLERLLEQCNSGGGAAR